MADARFAGSEDYQIVQVDDPENLDQHLNTARDKGWKKVGLLIKGLFGDPERITPVYYELDKSMEIEYFVHLDALERKEVRGHFVRARCQRTVMQFYPGFLPLRESHSMQDASDILLECFRDAKFINFCCEHSTNQRRDDSESIFELNELPSPVDAVYRRCQSAPVIPVYDCGDDPEEIPEGKNGPFFRFGVGFVAAGVGVFATSCILLAVTCGAAVPGLLVSFSLMFTLTGVAAAVGMPITAAACDGDYNRASKTAGALLGGSGLGWGAGLFGNSLGLTASNVSQVTSLFGSTASTTAVGSAAFIGTMIGVGAGFFAAFVLMFEGIRMMRMSRRGRHSNQERLLQNDEQSGSVNSVSSLSSRR